jgi:hypothetical protein
MQLWMMPDRSRMRPRDPNELAATVVAIAMGAVDDRNETDTTGKNPAAVELGCLGELKGRRLRAQSLTAGQRSEIARKTTQARYGKKR